MKEKEIIKKYNKYFKTKDLDVGPGWFFLINELCSKIDILIKEFFPELLTKKKPFKIVQVKSKFGGLRFYTTNSIKQIETIIEQYEIKSFETCEECGRLGDEVLIDGYLYTLCNKHAKKGARKKI